MASFTLTTGKDQFTGADGEGNSFFIAPSTLQSTDIVTGATAGSFVDALVLTAGGAVTAEQLSGVTNIEQFLLSSDGNNVALTNGLVANSSLVSNLFIVTGGAGNDTVDASAVTNGKAIEVDAGSGADTIIGGNGDDHLFGGTGSDTLIGGDGNDVLVGNETLFENVHDTLSGGAGNDTLYGEAADTIDGGAGFDVLQLVNDFDMHLDLAASSVEYVVSGFGNDVYTAANSTTAVEVYGSGGNDQITGGSGDDNLWGGVGNDTLVGNDGNDLLVGDLGADSLSGGAGNDRLYIDSDDTFIDGGSGFDAAYIASGTGMTLNMAAANLEWAADFAGGNDTIDASGVAVNVEIYGAAGDDILTGGSGNDLIFAGTGNDTIVGGPGDDALVGEAGVDSLSGGTGNDRLYVDSDDILIDGGDGYDAVYIVGGTGLTLNMAASNVEWVGDQVDGNDAISGVGTGMFVYAAGGNDTIGITNGSFAQIDGGTGLDRILLTGAGQTFNLTANAFKISNIEVIATSGPTSQEIDLTNTDVPQVNSSSNYLYVIGDANDIVTLGDTWSVITANFTNPAVSANVFTQYHNTATNSELYVSNSIGSISVTTSSAINNPPGVFLDGPLQLDHAANYATGNAAGVAISDTDGVVDDPDTTDSATVSSHITQLVATLTDPHSGALEFLALSGTGQTLAANNGIAVSGLNTSALTLTGSATDSVYQNLLREIRYVNSDVSDALNASARHITVRANDGFVDSSTATATISLTNGDNPPTANDFSIDLQEDINTSQAFNVLTAAAASDPDAGDTLHVFAINGSAAKVGVTQTTTHGQFVVDSAGNASFFLNNGSAAVQALAAGDTVQDSFTLGVSDQAGREITRTVTVDIHGTNDAAILSADTRSLTETNSATDISSSGTLTISDVDSSATFTVQSGTPGTYGSFSIGTNGAWTYTASSAHNEFAAGTTHTDTFAVASADGTLTSVTINILGSNDAAVLSADTRSLTETNSAADISSSGTLTISDVDSSATFAVQSGTPGTYGSFSIGTNGAWTYTASSAHNEFAAGTTHTDTFAVASADGTPTSVTINILGSNDAPTLDLDTTDGNFVADSGQPASFATAYTSGAPAIPVAGSVAIADDGNALTDLVVHLQVVGGADLNAGETLGLPAAYETGLESLGFTVTFDTTDPTDYVLTIAAPVGTPATAATFSDIIQHLTYSDPVTDFSFVPDDRSISFTLIDDGGLDTSGQLASPVTSVAISADVSDTTGLDGFNGGRHGNTILGDAGDDTIHGGVGNDLINGGTGDDSLSGGDGNDAITGAAGDDSIAAGDGNDTVQYAMGDGSDSVDGGSDIDTFAYSSGSQVSMTVTAGGGVTFNDGLFSTTLANVEVLQITLDSGDDNVVLTGDFAGSGVTSVSVDVGEGTNTINASGVTSATALTLTAGSGNDSITGGAGDDHITGGSGDDHLAGGAGNDTFVFASTFGSDTISDFVSGADLIDLPGFTLADIAITPSGGDSIIDVNIGATHYGSITVNGIVHGSDLIFT